MGDDGDARRVVVARLGGFGGEVLDETDGSVPEVVEGLAASGDARGVVPGSKRAPRAGVGRVLADVAPGNALQETHVALAELGVVDHVVVGRVQRGGDGGGGVGGAGEVGRVYGEGNASEAAFGDGDAHEACLGPTHVVQGGVRLALDDALRVPRRLTVANQDEVDRAPTRGGAHGAAGSGRGRGRREPDNDTAAALALQRAREILFR